MKRFLKAFPIFLIVSTLALALVACTGVAGTQGAAGPEIPAAQAIQDYQAFPALTALLVPWALRVSKGPKVSKDLLERTELPERPAPPSQWLSRCPPVKLRKDGPGSTSPVRAGRTMRP